MTKSEEIKGARLFVKTDNGWNPIATVRNLTINTPDRELDHTVLNDPKTDMDGVWKRRHENLIIQALEANGHTFEHPLELISFLKSRCRIEYFQKTKTSLLYADNKPVAEWRDYTPKIELEGNTVTATCREFKIIHQ